MTEAAGAAAPTADTTNAGASAPVSNPGTGEPGAALAQAPGAAGGDGSPPASSPAAGATATAEKPVATNGAATADAGAADKPVEPAWPENWRDMLAGDDDKLRDRLGRFATPKDVTTSWRELERKMANGELKAAKPKDETPEAVTAWRKANGIPEKHDDYQVAIPEDLAKHEGMKTSLDAVIGSLKPVFHAANMTADQVKTVSDAYLAMEAETLRHGQHEARRLTDQYRADLAREFGHNYEGYTRAASEHLTSTLGADGAAKMADIVLADGTRLGDNPLFVRYSVNSALQASADGDLVTSTYAEGGKSVEETYREMMEVRFTDPAKYNSEAHQAKMMRLAAKLSR